MADQINKTKMIQGKNAPLAWSVSSLYNTLKEEKIDNEKFKYIIK